MKIIPVFLLLLSMGASAQIRITGKIITAEGKPVPFTNVIILNTADSSVVKGTVTNESGNYEIHSIIPGIYLLRYSAIGFQTYNTSAVELKLSDSIMNLGTHTLNIDGKYLKEVVVNSRNLMYKNEIDRVVVNVENSIFTKGGSALEILERSPGVIVDKQQGSISLNGKSGVMVMMDGRLMRLPLSQVIEMLKSMSADNIKKVELMATPPAKYDAEGSAGLINIVLKKSTSRGTKGSVSLSGGYGLREKERASLNLTHNTGAVGFYGIYSFSHEKSYNEGVAGGFQNAPTMGGPMNFKTRDIIYPVSKNHNAIAGFDATLKKTIVGASINFRRGIGASDIKRQYDYYIYPDSIISMKAFTFQENRSSSIISSAYAERELRSGGRITFDVSYLYYKNESYSTIESSFLDKNGQPVNVNDTIFSFYKKGFGSSPIKSYVGKIDYTKRLDTKTNLEAGVKMSHTNSSSMSGTTGIVDGVPVLVPETSLDVLVRERISAAYATINRQIDSTMTLIIGARYEYYQNRMDNPVSGKTVIDRKMGNFFPNVFFNKKLNDNADLQFSFTKRVSRPSYNDLAPFITYNDPVSVVTGNSYLKPAITTNLKAGFNHRNYSLSLLATRDENLIVGYQVVTNESKNLLYISPQNVSYKNSLNLQADIPLQLTKWWSVNVGFGGGPRQIKLTYTAEPVKKTYFAGSLYGSQSFVLPKKFTFEISGWLNSNYYSGSIKVKSVGSLSLGVQKEFNKNFGTLTFSVYDLLRSQINTHAYGTFAREAFSLDSKVTFFDESRRRQIFRLTYYKSFGNSAIKDQRKRTLGSKEEIDRLR